MEGWPIPQSAQRLQANQQQTFLLHEEKSEVVDGVACCRKRFTKRPRRAASPFISSLFCWPAVRHQKQRKRWNGGHPACLALPPQWKHFSIAAESAAGEEKRINLFCLIDGAHNPSKTNKLTFLLFNLFYSLSSPPSSSINPLQSINWIELWMLIVWLWFLWREGRERATQLNNKELIKEGWMRLNEMSWLARKQLTFYRVIKEIKLFNFFMKRAGNHSFHSTHSIQQNSINFILFSFISWIHEWNGRNQNVL